MAATELSRPIVPKEYGGMWIAWNNEQTKIIASGPTLADAFRAADAAGETDPVLEKVPRSDVRFLGGRFPRTQPT